MTEGRAIGVLETRGMAALTAAGDAMLKAAEVRVAGRHGIGSGWVTLVVEGQVAAVQRSVEVGRLEAQRHGEVIYSQVIPRPVAQAMARLPHPGVGGDRAPGAGALGMLETQGLTPLIVGADAMVKAANVALAGWAFIGGALCHAVVRGDVAAVQTAVQAGQQAAGETGTVHATLVLPQPIPGTAPLLPPPPAAPAEQVGALGVLETTGYVTSVGGADGMVKAAEVEVVRLTIGSGGRIAALARGALDSVTAALEAGRRVAEQVGTLNASHVISRPDPQVMACFGGVAPAAPGARALAMGLIETRSTVALVKGVDEMLKAAQVEHQGRYKVGYFLTAGVVRGDVGAVRAALDVGAVEAARHGELVSVHLIPYPYPELEERLPHR
ncbi:MAG: BMC domain-containing protein [Candidatus Latescibacterota bacterium]